MCDLPISQPTIILHFQKGGGVGVCHLATQRGRTLITLDLNKHAHLIYRSICAHKQIFPHNPILLNTAATASL